MNGELDVAWDFQAMMVEGNRVSGSDGTRQDRSEEWPAVWREPQTAGVAQDKEVSEEQREANRVSRLGHSPEDI